MTGSHPSDVELLEYLEGELTPDEAGAVRVHLAACAACAAQVAEAERARTVLRASPLLDLPPERRDALVRDLPRQERDRPRLGELLSSPRRLVVVLAPVAAAIVAVAVLTTTGGGNERSATGGVTATAAAVGAAPEAGAAGAATTASSFDAAKAPALRTKGPAREVARLLRAKGFDARVRHGRVQVSGSTAAKVEAALAGRPSGSTAVIVAP